MSDRTREKINVTVNLNSWNGSTSKSKKGILQIVTRSRCWMVCVEKRGWETL